MSNPSPEDANNPETTGSGTRLQLQGASPYATGGGGVTFERKVAVKNLAHLLTGNGATEFGDGRRVVSVAFQQAPDHPVDDLVVRAVCPNGLQPPLLLALAVRRSPKIVQSDEPSRKLILQFVRAVTDGPSDGQEYRLGLVVSGSQQHAKHLARLADLAVAQMDAPGFFDLIQTPDKFASGLRTRLDQLGKLVERSLQDLGVLEPSTDLIQQRTWQLLSMLKVLMPRLESPDETDWADVTNSLIAVARDSDLAAASSLRDRLIFLASEYSPKAARVDLAMVRRDSHALLDTTLRLHKGAWRTLKLVDQLARESVRTEITEADDGRSLRLDRKDAVAALIETVSGAEAVVVSGESGVGKSALAVSGITTLAHAEQDQLQAVCVNLRDIPDLVITLEETLGQPLSTILSELSAPQRVLVIDGADAVAEGKQNAFHYLVGAARNSGVKVVAVTSIESKQAVLNALNDRFDTTDVEDCVVPPLSDSEIDEVVETFSALRHLGANPRSRELLRRLVVVQLLVRGRISGTPLTDADAMNEVWFGLVRRYGASDRGSPDARETALLRLAELELGKGERLDVISGIDPAALNGLRRDGLLRDSVEEPFRNGPDFGHDEVRRYAVARLLLASGDPAPRLLLAGAPRWSLGAARLACQAWLSHPGTPAMPLKGRLVAQQASFDKLAGAGHGIRWSDVPGEALLTLATPDALLRDAWPELLADEAVGLRRLARLVDQRLRDETGVVDVNAVEPIVALLLESPAPWRTGGYVQDLLRAWLRAHAIAGTPVGHPLRVLLRQLLIEACQTADRRFVEKRESASGARVAPKSADIRQNREFMEGLENESVLFSSIGYGSRHRRRRPKFPSEITNKIVLEFLALLGPDVGDDGEAILRRVASDAPWHLGPAVDEFLTGHALASARQGFLAELTEAYYLDDEVELDGLDVFADGVRKHLPNGLRVPLAAWNRGPFAALFRTDFTNAVVVLNRVLNHAARVRSQKLTDLAHAPPLRTDDVGQYEIELTLAGEPKLYVGDEHVWRWYRGTAVGPYPCFSALQALERECDRLIEIGAPIRTLISTLLNGCENLAMVGLVVGLIVRHLEDADHLLDPYISEPVIWLHEFSRVVQEASPFAPDSNALAQHERRKWSLREAAICMVVRADAERVAELRAVGEILIANARRLVDALPDPNSTKTGPRTESTQELLVVQARAWASSLDRDRIQARETSDGLIVEATPPADVVDALRESNEDLERTGEAIRLFVRYNNNPSSPTREAIGRDDLVDDIGAARKLLESPSSSGHRNPWDTAALVAAAALEAHLVQGIDLPDDALRIAAEIILQICDASPRRDEFEGTLYEEGADRSAARVIPLFLLPIAAKLRALLDERDGLTTFERAEHGAINLARELSDEVRLYLARGLEHVWSVPCTEHGRCHHELGWRIATETLRYCALGPWDPDVGQRSLLVLGEPLAESLGNVAADSIIVSRLDGAIRALAPAAMADICISARVHNLLSALFAAQRRSLLREARGNPDDRGTHTLVSARALLTLARNGDETAIFEHIDAYKDNAGLLDGMLRALSAAAEESPDRAATARRIWPNIVHHVLELRDSNHTLLRDPYYGDLALAALLPNLVGELPYLYREVDASPIVWWNPLELRLEVEKWLSPAMGNAMCVDQLISFIRSLELDDQILVGLPWLAKIVLADSDQIARGAFTLAAWLIETRSVAVDVGLSTSWQEVVDALVVAGDSRLAPYSD